MAFLFDIDLKATGRSADGSGHACAPSTAAPLAGAASIRNRGGMTAGETSALVARCVL